MTAAGRKARVAARFNAAAERYDAASPLQREAAARLAQRVLALGGTDGRVLEVGCGTGHLTRELHARIGGEWIVSDIAPAMAAACRRSQPAARAVVMDAERPAFAPGSFDLVVSSLTAQWFGDLPAALGQLSALLAPGGRLAVATLGRGTFAEWRAAHAALGLAAATPDYPSAEELAHAFPAAMQTAVDEELIRIRLGEPLDFLRGLRAIGADTPLVARAPLGPGRMRRVLRQLAGDAPGISYRLLYAIAQRPA